MNALEELLAPGWPLPIAYAVRATRGLPLPQYVSTAPLPTREVSGRFRTYSRWTLDADARLIRDYPTYREERRLPELAAREGVTLIALYSRARILRVMRARRASV